MLLVSQPQVVVAWGEEHMFEALVERLESVLQDLHVIRHVPSHYANVRATAQRVHPGHVVLEVCTDLS